MYVGRIVLVRCLDGSSSSSISAVCWLRLQPVPTNIHMSEKYSVIVTDDNVDLAETTCEILNVYGLNARPCFSGTEAISSVSVGKPDVIILDIGMPTLDGFATLSALRALPKCSTVPIIAVTAYSSVEYSKRINDAGFTAHLVKPVQIDLLVATIIRLAKHEANRAHAAVGRLDSLTAQRLEVAIVYLEMLGIDDARKYLRSVAMPSDLADRVLLSSQRRS